MKTSPIHYLSIYPVVILILSAWSFTANADDFHKPPYNFLFGNHIDSHQETRLKKKGGQPVSLAGFLYIEFTGEIDLDSGLPIAKHPSGTTCEDNENDCVVGWEVKGSPGEAVFLYHFGVNGDDHPVWLLNRVDIPQPGSYTHFHWIAKDSTDPRAPGAVPNECNVDSASALEPAAVNFTCPGWFLQITAVEEFAFQHGNEVFPVYLGTDNATHLNLVTNYKAILDPDIDPTRP